jgi:hypothetical protein
MKIRDEDGMKSLEEEEKSRREVLKHRFEKEKRLHLFEASLKCIEKEITNLSRERAGSLLLLKPSSASSSNPFSSSSPSHHILNKGVNSHTNNRIVNTFQNRIRHLCSNPYFPLSSLLHYPKIPWNKDVIFRHHPFLDKNDPQSMHQTVVQLFPKHSKLHKYKNVKSSSRPQHRFPISPSICFVQIEAQLSRGKRFNPYRFRSWSKHPQLPIPLVLRYLFHGPWDIFHLLQNRPWTLEWLLILQRKQRLHFRSLSHNIFLSFHILIYFYKSPWDWRALATNPAFPPQLILNRQYIMRHAPNNVLVKRQWNYLQNHWKWSDVWTNPRINDSAYFFLRQHSISATGTPKRGLLSNYFFYDKPLRSRSAFILQKWFKTLHFRFKLHRLLTMCTIIHQKVPETIGFLIFSFFSLPE